MKILMFRYFHILWFNWMWHFVFLSRSEKDNEKALKSDMIYFPYFEISAAFVISTPSVKALKLSKCWEHLLIFSWRSKSVDWFLYDNGLCHERVKANLVSTLASKKRAYLISIRGRHFPKKWSLFEGGRW